MPYSPDPKSFISDICRVNPHQLAPTMGTLGVGIMNSMAFSFLASINPEVDGNQEMDLTIRSLNFRVGSLGSIRLSDPTKPDPSASKTTTSAMSKSSVGSSSKANSLVSFATAKNLEGKIKELDEAMGNLGLGGAMDQTYLSQ
jgi:hypothetical protein